MNGSKQPINIHAVIQHVPVAPCVLPHKRIFFTVCAMIDEIRPFYCVPKASEKEEGKKRRKRRKRSKKKIKVVTYIRKKAGRFPPPILVISMITTTNELNL